MSSDRQFDKLVLEGWQSGRCPMVDGIVFADGRIVLLQMTSDYIPNSKYPERQYAFHLKKVRTLAVQDLERDGKLHWSHIYRQFESVDETRNLRAWCGETSWGSEGFVALVRADSNLPIWIAIFEESNPFKAVTLTETLVEAVSTYENVWRFPIDSPEDATVDSAPLISQS